MSSHNRIASDITDYLLSLFAVSSFSSLVSETFHLILIAGVPVLVKEGLVFGFSYLKKKYGKDE